MPMKKLLIVTGPQGSGNHLFARLFSAHPNVKGWESLHDKYWVPSDEEPFARYWVYPEELKKEFFEEAELDYEAETVLRREIVPGGKSRAFINDTPVTLDKINQLSNFLIDVHSQNENQFLFKSEYQFLVLDALANNDELLDEYRKHLNQFNQTQLEYNELLLKVNKVKQETDYNQFLFDELINEELSPDILTSLKDEIDQLSNVEDLKLYLSQSIQIIDEDQMGLLTQLSILKTALNNAVNKSKSLSISSSFLKHALPSPCETIIGSDQSSISFNSTDFDLRIFT